MKSLDDLNQINSDATAKMEEAVAAIDILIDNPGLSLIEESRLISRRATLQAQINNQKLVHAHLKAASVVVEFSAKEERTLDAFNEKMDQFIVEGLTVNALLALAPKIVDTAMQISNMLTLHTSQA